MKRFVGERVKVDAFKRGGYYVLRISNYRSWLVATKGSKKPHWESGWTYDGEKKFENRDSANKYFAAIKKSNPDLVLVEDSPNKFISHDGTVKEY